MQELFKKKRVKLEKINMKNCTEKCLTLLVNLTLLNLIQI